MDVFRRLTTPTLKKLYRFVLKRLVGRFLDDDIALEQLDVQLRAGRVELTDLNINVSAVAELLPNLSFELARAHVGRLRVEISYSKLLTESLAFFVDDVLIEIAPSRFDTNGTHAADTDMDPAEPDEHLGGGPRGADLAHNSARGGREGTAGKPAGENEKPADQGQVGEGGESLDFLAQWIEQITSKVKVVVNNLTARVVSAGQLQDAAGFGVHHRQTGPYLELRCSSLNWCDETPDSSAFMSERPQRPLHSAATRTDRIEAPGMVNAHKRLTLGLITAEWSDGQPGGKRELMRMGGKGCVVIKHERRIGSSTPADVVLDVDVSLRHADVTLCAQDCAGMCTLSSAYIAKVEQPVAEVAEDVPVVTVSPVKPLFREDFWYFDGLPPSGENISGELNFDTLSGLLEQYTEARARLAEAGGYGHGVFGIGSHLSLGQSDVFYDCEDTTDDGTGRGGHSGAEADRLQNSAKVRVRMTGLDVTLLLAEEAGGRSHSGSDASFVRLQMRRMIQTLHSAETWNRSVAEVGTFVADFTSGHRRPVRVLEVSGADDSCPCIEANCTTGVTDSEDMDHGDGRVSVDVRCLPVAAIMDARLVGLLGGFIAQSTMTRPVVDDGGCGGHSNHISTGVASRNKLAGDRNIHVAVSAPKLAVRLPADPSACSSMAHVALIDSVRNGTSPVGWTLRETGGEAAAPALVLEVEGATVTSCFGSPTTPTVTLECTRVACEMLLVCSGGGRGIRDGEAIGLYFLEASRSGSEAPLKVEYGLAEAVGKAGRLGVARPASADLKFLHTWEPNDGVDSGLGEVPPPVGFGDEQGGESGVIEEDSSSHQVLLCALPRVAVELSRLELVVLADILAGLSSPPDDSRDDVTNSDKAPSRPPAALEVLIEARGATIVLHEAAAFAEEPGPHSYVLNLGSACLHLGGSNKSVQGRPQPFVTVSSGDACVHETLRRSANDGSKLSGLERIAGPLLFLPGKEVLVYLAIEDLPKIGFVPVLYQTKWAKGTSPVAAELMLAVSGAGAVSKTITATLNLYDVSLRHTVASSWLPRLLGLVVGDVPAGRAASPNNDATNGMGEPGGNLTKMFITVFNGVVDYMPQSQGTGPARAEPRKPARGAAAAPKESPATEGRAVFPIGVLRVSSNMVAGAPMQGFKVVIRDIGLHMSNRVMDYRSEDAGLCCGALGVQRERDLPLVRSNFSSVQEYLETSHFVQIATLNFLDAFLRIRSQVLVPRDAFTAVELWMGVLHVYTCQDSLSTCQALLREWWALFNECRTAAADLGKAEVGKPKLGGRAALHDDAQEIVPTSLLDDVEQDAFLPGNSRESLPAGETKADSGALSVAGGLQSRKQQSLVIEDYYCVSVEPSATQTAPTGSILMDSHENERREGTGLADGIIPGGSSFISEGEGPAQWLVAPKAGLGRDADLAMESAEETSDSEGENDVFGGAKPVGLVPQLPTVARRTNFGFSLPAPIEIELEDRHDGENLDAKESADVVASITGEPSSPSTSSEGESRSFTNSPSQDDKGRPQSGRLSPRRDTYDQSDPAHSALTHSALTHSALMAPAQGQLDADQLDAEPSLAPEPLFRRDSLPLGERESVWVGSSSPENLREADQSIQPAQPHAPAKTEQPQQGEQEARWLARDTDGSSESFKAAAAVGTRSSYHQPDGYRVYPHYIPIPTTAEATSLPFLSGDPLLALGHNLEKNSGGEAEVEGAERTDQKLQFQLAIHDLSICWRLFKGRDWLERGLADEDGGGHQRGNSDGGRYDAKVVARGPPFRTETRGKSRRTEKRRESAEPPPAAEGAPKPRKTELLDALLENYQDERGGRGDSQIKRRASRHQPKVKLLNQSGEAGLAKSIKRTGRDTSCVLEVVLENSSLRLDSFHPGPPPSLLSNLLFSIKNLYASDTLTSSRPRKTVQHWRDDVRHPREFQQKMVTVRMTARSPSDHFCPEDTPLGDEIMLKVRLLPIHLSFGQHTVDFIRSFSPPAQPVPHVRGKEASGEDHAAAQKGGSPFFISCCDVGPCKVKIDYQPRTLKVGALQNGDYMELLNLFPLEGVHLTLQKLLLTGVSGWNGVTQLLLQSWVQDITSNQLHKFLAGTTPVRPLVTVGKGVADLVLLPVEQYRRDGRVLRGLRKGTQSFLRAITIETLHTSHRVASFVARTLDDVVTQPGSRASLRGLEYYDEQPTGVLDSLEHAYDALAKEMQVAAQTIIAIPYEEQEEVIGPHGRSYVRSVARALPVAVLRPVVGASEALSCTLLGFRNYMSPVIRKEEEERWR